jgi:hypothetical protein
MKKGRGRKASSLDRWAEQKTEPQARPGGSVEPQEGGAVRRNAERKTLFSVVRRPRSVWSAADTEGKSPDEGMFHAESPDLQWGDYGF